MSPSLIFNLAVVIGFILLVVYSVRKNKQHDSMFVRCAEALGMTEAKFTHSTIVGKVKNRLVEIRFHPGSKNTPRHTTVDVQCEPCAILLHLRKQTADEEQHVERGTAVDVKIGNAVFDSTWLVEGAPAKRILRILSEPTLQQRLIEFGQLDGAGITIEDNKLNLRKNGDEQGPGLIATERFNLAITLAEAVVADATLPIEEGEVRVDAATYRSAPRVDENAGGRAEIAELKLLQARRTMGELRVGSIAAAATLSVICLAMQWSEMAKPFTIMIGVFCIFSTVLFGSMYVNARKRAGNMPHDKAIVWAAIIFWIFFPLYAARIFLW
ncbi:MAG: hypothetical protein IPK82_41995 [Polyangiaceae bacterium]|nr:hypothetical protein [Polyangiaceae bacterium]